MLAAARLSCGEPETSGKNDRPVPVDGRCDDLQEPVLVRRVEPSYPAHIRKQGWEGQVELKGIIGSDGKVSDLSVLKSPGKPLSDLAAQAVSQWVYKPAYCKDLEKPVRVSIIFRTSFTLKHK
jgi:protein TonB